MSKKVKKKKVSSLVLSGQPAWFSNRMLHRIVIFALGFLVYANTLGHDYALDDGIVITKNMFTEQGLKGVPGILKYDTFYGFFQEEGKDKLVVGGRYRPLSLLTFALEVQLFGMNPFVGHLVNALLNGLVGLVLYGVVLLLLPPGRHGTKAWFMALGAALLFVTHPLHTEVVANIKGRDEILALLGSLGALYFAVRAVREGKKTGHLWGALLLFLAMLAKENAVMFIFVIPLTYYFFTNTTLKNGLLASLPYVAAFIVFFAIRSSILGSALGDPPLELMNNPFVKIENGKYVPLGFIEKMATVMLTLGIYLKLLFFPHPLTHDYYPRHIELMQWTDPSVLLSLLVYAGLFVYAVLGLRKKDIVSYSIFFFLFTLFIVSNIIFPIGTNMAERVAYMPSVGFCLALPALLFSFFGKKDNTFARFQPALLVLGLFVIGFSVKTIVRNPAWKDNYTLFTTDLKTSEKSAKLQSAIGGETVDKFKDAEDEALKSRMLNKAVGHLQKAIDIHPNYRNVYLLMGNAFFYNNEFEKALTTYENALKVDPDFEDARRNIGLTYRDGGRYYGEEQGNLQKAMEYLQKAYEYRPDDYEVLRLLGVANGIAGRPELARDWFKKAADASPETADAWFNLGTAELNLGNTETGQTYRQKAIDMDPEVLQRMNQ